MSACLHAMPSACGGQIKETNQSPSSLPAAEQQTRTTNECTARSCRHHLYFCTPSAACMPSGNAGARQQGTGHNMTLTADLDDSCVWYTQVAAQLAIIQQYCVSNTL